ncbi:hypothetical protein ACGF07_19400 [Kitasatospora sp. NPDC048194]|uniref:hypothetical protein n=1 Tax=Kitasatospora sp. NPDC048194 TaxID=3364045 RepID=UPI003716E8F2
MSARRTASRPTGGPARTAVVAVALAALGTGGTADAAAGPVGGQVRSVPVRSGSVPVMEVRTADGVLTVRRSSDRPPTSDRPSAGAARPTSATTCNGVDPKVCFAVNGSGYYVSTMENTTYYGAGAWADIQIKSPTGALLTGTSFYAAGGGWYTATYAPYGYVTAGWWCGFSNADGGEYTGSCIDVSN